MICQRCGNCCLTMFVVIRDRDTLILNPADVLCPSVTWEVTKATCAVHEEPWYNKSPCYVYGNHLVDPDFACKAGKPCGVGAMIQRKGGLHVVKCEFPQARMEDLEVVTEADPDMVGEMFDDVATQSG